MNSVLSKIIDGLIVNDIAALVIYLPFAVEGFALLIAAINAAAFIAAINKAKPSTAKGRYITNAAISLTMSPSVIIDNMEIMEIR